MGILEIRRGRAPNCSSSGSIIGLALVSSAGASALLTLWSHRLLQWKSKVRPETFGAVVQGENPPGRVFVDSETAGLLGVNERPSGVPDNALSAPTEVHVALTHKCPVQCSGCYLDASPSGEEAKLAALKIDLDALAEMGVFEVALGGGEALLHPEIIDLAQYIRSREMIPNLTISGFGVERFAPEQLASLFGQINLSIDGPPDVYKAVRGWKGYALGVRSLRKLAQAGGRVGVNTVLTRPLLSDRNAFFNFAKDLVDFGMLEWQWLRFKPSGRGAPRYDDFALTRQQREGLLSLALEVEQRFNITIRWDCAMFPFLADRGIPVSRLRQLGVLGCTGGERLWARDIDGAFAPCSFVPSDSSEHSVAERWRADSTVQAWRQRASTPPEPCAQCEYRSLCRGGCRVVAEYLTGDPLAPDPECPRVMR